MIEDTIRYKEFKRPEIRPIDFLPIYGLYTYQNRMTHEYLSFIDFIKKNPVEIGKDIISDTRGLINPSTRKKTIDHLVAAGTENWPLEEKRKECTLTALQNVLLVSYHICGTGMAVSYGLNQIL